MCVSVCLELIGTAYMYMHHIKFNSVLYSGKFLRGSIFTDGRSLSFCGLQTHALMHIKQYTFELICGLATPINHAQYA